MWNLEKISKPSLFKKPMGILADQKYDLSVIIVNYRSKAYLKDNLASICEKFEGRVNFEIIIVNNDQKENLDDIKKEFNVKIIEQDGNFGFGTAVNAGAGIAKGRYLFFLNPDCEIISSNIGKVLDEFESNNNIGIIGSKITDEKGNLQKWIAGEEINLVNLLKNNLGLSGSRKIWESKNKIEAGWVAGTAMFAEKDLFSELSGFDEKFFMYFEDNDLCKRARGLEKTACYFPDFQVSHSGGKSYSDKKTQKGNYYDSQEYYFKKHRSKAEYWIVKRLRKLIS